MRWLKPLSLRARSRSGMTLVEVIVAAVLTVIIGYVVLSVVFSAGQGLNSQEASVNAHHELDATLTGMEGELHNAQLPLVSLNSENNDLRFIVPGKSSGKMECIRYSTVTTGTLSQLYQQSQEVSGAKACKEVAFQTPGGAALLTNLASNQNIFTPVEKGIVPENLKNESEYIAYENKTAPVGVVVSLTVTPTGGTGLSSVNQRTFVDFDVSTGSDNGGSSGGTLDENTPTPSSSQEESIMGWLYRGSIHADASRGGTDAECAANALCNKLWTAEQGDTGTSHDDIELTNEIYQMRVHLTLLTDLCKNGVAGNTLQVHPDGEVRVLFEASYSSDQRIVHMVFSTPASTSEAFTEYIACEEPGRIAGDPVAPTSSTYYWLFQYATGSGNMSRFKSPLASACTEPSPPAGMNEVAGTVSNTCSPGESVSAWNYFWIPGEWLPPVGPVRDGSGEAHDFSENMSGGTRPNESLSGFLSEVHTLLESGKYPLVNALINYELGVAGAGNPIS